MKYLILFLLVLLTTSLPAQGKIWYGVVERLPNEDVTAFVERIVIEEQDLEEDDTTTPWRIMHVPVEIKFGLVEERRIVFVFRESGEDEMEIGILTPIGDNQYQFESFGNLIYGFPTSDEILSIFAFNVDIDIHPALELCIIGKGEVRTVTEDGMTGCCEAIYSTAIYYEEEEKTYSQTKNKYYFREFGSNSTLDGWKNAPEVKAAIHRNLFNEYLNFDGDIDRFAKKHFKNLDSIDRKYGLGGERKIIDKIYQLDLGTNQTHYVISFTRTVEGIDFYSLGIFTLESGKKMNYLESHKIELNGYQNFKNYKVETIFTYDADQYGEIKYKEIVVLLSADEVQQQGEKEWAVFIGSPSYDNSRIHLLKGWHYGIHDEKTAADIKKAIENYHNPKEDETPRD